MYWSASSTSYASCAACSCDAVQLLGAGEVSDCVDCVTDRGDCECAASPRSSSESVDCDRVRVRGRRLSRTGGGWKDSLSPPEGLRTGNAYLIGYWGFIAVTHQPHTPPRTHARRTSVSVGPAASDWHMPGGHRRGLRTAARR
jgi:hypothetical protein